MPRLAAARSRLLCLIFLCLAGWLGGVASAQPAPDLSLESARQTWAAFLAQKKFAKAQWGVKVVSAETGQEIFAHHAQSLLRPASTAKLFTAAFAFDRLGPGFRIRTSIHGRQPPGPDGTLAGDLVLYGRGDPSITSRWPGGGDPMAVLAKQVLEAGVKRVEGNLVADSTWLAAPPFGDGWTWEDLLNGYGAPADALVYEDNVAELRVFPDSAAGNPARFEIRPALDLLEVVNSVTTGPARNSSTPRIYRRLGEHRVRLGGTIAADRKMWSVNLPVHDAPRWFGLAFARAFMQQGGQIGGRLQTRSWPDEAGGATLGPELAFRESPPVAELAKRMMKQSVNLQAQLLFLQAGARGPGPSGLGTASEAAAKREFDAFLSRSKIPAGEVLFEEGSGLSRSSLVTPNALVELLKLARRAGWSSPFLASLPVAGQDGTLAQRFTEMSVSGAIQAKTGTLQNVSALAGYARPRSGELLAFALVLNAYPGPGAAEKEVDELARLILRLKDRAPASRP